VQGGTGGRSIGTGRLDDYRATPIEEEAATGSPTRTKFGFEALSV